MGLGSDAGSKGRRPLDKKIPFVAHPQTRPQIMGIVNITPDSFSDGGQFFSPDAALRHIEDLTRDGADIIDIGAESTRPGAESIDTAEECRRLEPVLRHYKDVSNLPLSVDTSKSEVAHMAIGYGATIINDIAAGRDPQMLATVAKSSAAYVVMHMQGEPRQMQSAPVYSDVLSDVMTFLQTRRDAAYAAGIASVILDPGIGFGKTLEHNLVLLRSLSEITALGPVLLGTSRKSFIGHIHGDMTVSREEGTLVSNMMGAMAGVSILRVHDVASMRRALAVYHRLR